MSGHATVIVWAVIGVAYAGTCVWLTVRIFNRRKPWMIWTAAALIIAPVAYVLSSGPMYAFAFQSPAKTQVASTRSLPDGTVVKQVSTMVGPA